MKLCFLNLPEAYPHHKIFKMHAQLLVQWENFRSYVVHSQFKFILIKHIVTTAKANYDTIDKIKATTEYEKEYSQKNKKQSNNSLIKA